MGSSGTKRSTAAVTTRRITWGCAALVGLAAAASAQARPLSVVTHEDPAAPGAFTLSFGDLGIETSSFITSTTYELSVDPVRGTARFVSYLQHVEPLVLPGGISTGDITVEVVDGSSSGTFDPLTRTFSTTEMYAVHFTGDLSAFGLSSPVFLPSSSAGELALDPLDGGAVTMDWSGSGELANPFDPSDPLEFTYACAVNTVFPPDAENVVGLVLVPEVAALALPQWIARGLVDPLEQALAHIQRGNEARAVKSLREFVRKVELLRGSLIGAADAFRLVAGATVAIDLLGVDRGSVAGGMIRRR